MANEYLQRLPTSTGNTRVFTISCWLKHQFNGSSHLDIFHAYDGSSSNRFQFMMLDSGNNLEFWSGGTTGRFTKSTGTGVGSNERSFRDQSWWMHVVGVMNTPAGEESQRCKIYVNGVEQPLIDSPGSGVTGITKDVNPNQVNARFIHHIMGVANDASSNAGQAGCRAYMSDFFFVDGQALTPDVFGFYKQGKGYISAGSTQATDFRPGQWVPKTPRVIKTEINRRGGFGVNGFYLPMNDSNNFGADFHCDPNSIITLNEKLPQPRVGVASTASVGLGYTDALRADPYAANLVLALPFVSSGLCTNGTNVGVNTGFGDYSHIIRGSGSAKIVSVGGNTTISNVGTAETASIFYGSGAKFDGVDDFLTIPNSSDFSFGSGDFTVECWANFGNFSTTTSIVNLFENATARRSWSMEGRTNGAFRFEWFYDGTTSQSIDASTNTLCRGQWNHFAMVRRGTAITGYINGVAVGIKTDVGTQSLFNNTTDPLSIGALFQSGTPTQDFTGYIQDLRIYKGVAKYTGGFDVPKPYTPVGIATWRAVPDTTANNFATLNPLQKAVNSNDPGDFTDGNLTVTYDTSTNHGTTTCNVGIGTTGNWYAEARVNSLTDSGGFSLNIGITGIGRTNNSAAVSFNEVGVGYRADNGEKRVNATGVGGGTASAYGSSYTSGDIIGIGVSNGDLTFYKNGVSQGIAYTGITTFITNNLTDNLFFGCGDLASAAGGAISWNFGQNPTFSGNTTAGTFTDSNGKGLFKFQPPSGFLALCEDNLPTPAISDPGKYFKTVLYTGTGASRNIVGVGFTPDLVWIKERNGADNHRLVDSVRGPIRELYSSLTNAEAIDSGGVLSFDSDGFSLGNGNSYNESGINHVAWCWRAGAGTTSTNTDGSVTSVVSVNQTAGFSIVSYTGNGVSNATVGHGLGKIPAFGVVKCRDTNSASNEWRAQHKGLTSGNYIVLSSSAAQSAISGTSFGSLGTFTSSSTVTLQAGGSDSTTTNENGKRYIMYLWSEIESFSKFGSYVGNGNADGPFVYCGFKPAWVMFKNATAAGNEWFIYDTSRNSSNVMGASLLASSAAVENGVSLSNENTVDYLSNGFKLRTGNAGNNQSGQTIIFAAFAESPFTTANAK